jgi:hypothetical protein
VHAFVCDFTGGAHTQALELLLRAAQVGAYTHVIHIYRYVYSIYIGDYDVSL